MKGGEKHMQKGMTTPLIIAGVVLLVLAGGYFFMRGSGQTDPATDSDTMMQDDSMMEDSTMAPEESEMVDHEDMMMDDGSMEDVLEITVEGGSFYYDPNVIEAKVGQTVRVTLNSVDMMHDFDIDELNLDTEPVESGNSTTFEFTPDQAGEFEFYCSVGQHRANGMVGTLIVTE